MVANNGSNHCQAVGARLVVLMECRDSSVSPEVTATQADPVETVTGGTLSGDLFVYRRYAMSPDLNFPRWNSTGSAKDPR